MTFFMGAGAIAAPGGDPAIYIPPNAIFAVRSDNVTLSGATATAWPDQSSGAGNATGELVTNRPQIDTTTYGRQVIVTTASQGYFSLPAAIAAAILAGNDLPFTIAGVTRSDNGDDLLGFGGSVGGASPWLRIRHASSGRMQANKAASSATEINSITANTTFPDNAWVAWCVRCNGTTVDVWIDHPTTKTTTAGSFNAPDCTGAPTAGRLMSRPGTAGASAMHAGGYWVSNAAETDGVVANIMNSAIDWRDRISPP